MIGISRIDKTMIKDYAMIQLVVTNIYSGDKDYEGKIKVDSER